MLIHKTGNILNSKENIICHQVNVQGVMGGGLAKQIATTYPNVEKEYKKVCNSFNYDYEKLKGLAKNVKINDTQFIANCFTQKPNFETDYKAVGKCFDVLLAMCKAFNKTICIPYGYGSNIANGSWTKISQIFNKLSDEYSVPIVVYRLPHQRDLK